MKSQVNALLHVVQNGLFKDAILTYPALEGSLLKDMRRLALYCQSRGLGFFTLDLPHLHSIFLNGVKEGRLSLEGPLSRAVSKEVRVPRLFSGLWLRVFDKDACLKHEVDATAVAYLRMFLTFGSKLQVECSKDRIRAVMGAYYDVESKLRKPTLGWTDDNLGLSHTPHNVGCGTWNPELRDRTSNGNALGTETRDLYVGIHSYCGFNRNSHGHLFDSPLIAGKSIGDNDSGDSLRLYNRPMHVHLVQAMDGSSDFHSHSLPLFRKERGLEERVKLLEDQRILRQIQKVADLIVGSMSYYDPVEFSTQQDSDSNGIGFKHGPGAVAEGLKSWEKSQFPNWPQKLQNTFPYEVCGRTAGSPEVRPPNHEVASKLMSVPKTAKGPRLIAAEPASHMWCQQLTWRWLEREWKKMFSSQFISFRDQTLSGDLVLKASRDRELVTIDLSDASDRLTCWTVERMFRCNPSLLTALHAARTRYLRDSVSKDGDFLLLRKFASQGTATTFPIMSLVMAFISIGSTIEGEPTMAKIRKLGNQVRVFGDDIIIPSHGYVRLCRAMELLQLKVNMAKSYASGHFRESCGQDGYLGYDVTPIRPKTIVGDSPASCQAVVDNANNLFNKGYWHASNACLDLLPARLRRGIRIVGHNDVGFSGLTSYSGSDESHLIQRWNPSLHRYEVRVWQLFVQSQKRPRDGYSALLDFFASKHSHEYSRTVSEFADVRKTRIGLLWEPSNSCGRVFTRPQEQGYVR